MTTALEVTTEDLIAQLNLKPHPEGGFYREIYNDSSADGVRGKISSIYYLLEKGQSAHWHRVTDADEVWLWHGGHPLALYSKLDDGPVEKTTLGLDVHKGEVPQAIIQKNYWQSASAINGWALVSCVVGPAFEFDKMEFAPRGFEPGFVI